MGCVYCARNTVNGKCYIGQTVFAMEDRRKQHLQSAAAGDDLLFYHAIRKYGASAFEWSVVVDGLDDHELDFFECAVIRNRKTIAPDGYNLTDGGSTGRHCEEVKNRISESVRKQWQDEEFRAGRLEALRSEESRKAISEKSIQFWQSEEGRRLAAMNYEEKYGSERAAEVKKKQSDALAGKPKSDAAIENMRIAAQNKTPEKKANSYANLTAFNEQRAINGVSDEVREKLRKSRIGKTTPEETKVKMRIAQQARRAKERALA